MSYVRNFSCGCSRCTNQYPYVYRTYRCRRRSNYRGLIVLAAALLLVPCIGPWGFFY